MVEMHSTPISPLVVPGESDHDIPHLMWTVSDHAITIIGGIEIDQRLTKVTWLYVTDCYMPLLNQEFFQDLSNSREVKGVTREGLDVDDGDYFITPLRPRSCHSSDHQVSPRHAHQVHSSRNKRDRVRPLVSHG